MGQVYSWK